MKLKLFSILLLIALFTTACGATGTSVPTAESEINTARPTTVDAEGKLLPTPSVALAFAQGGVVSEILVHPGDTLATGDAIVQLVGIESAQAELAAAQLEQLLAQQALDALHRNALLTSSQTEQALLDMQEAYESEANGWNLANTENASDLELTLDEYVTAEEEYRAARDKLDALVDKGEDNREHRDAQEDFDAENKALSETYNNLLEAVAKNDQPLDEELTNLLKAVVDFEVAREMQARLDNTNVDPEALAAAESRLEAATAHVGAAQAIIELYELRAPFSGTLFSLDLAAGESVTPTLPIAFLANTSHWTVETKDLAEIDIANVAIGDRATIKLDAFPSEEFAGQVTEIDPVGREYLGDMTYKVTITLDESDPRFLWNMTATVTIDVEYDTF